MGTIQEQSAFLYAERLGRIFADPLSTVGFEKIREMGSLKFATVSVVPVMMDSVDYNWTATKIFGSIESSLEDFPSIQICSGTMENVYFGGGMLEVNSAKYFLMDNYSIR